ncbi:MAG: AAA family ATPase [Solirubrobacterales bacterium]|nr:AAA family ATPase [Solirubrobacterales bacterium]
MTVAVSSIRGGVGKTTVTLALADVLADSLRCGVVVVDADLEWGTAADSVPDYGRRRPTWIDLLGDVDQIRSPTDLAPYLLSLSHGVQLLPGPADPTQSENLDTRELSGLLELLGRFFPIVLLDLSPGSGLTGTLPEWAFSSADEIVAVSTPTVGALRRASRLLEHLDEAHPGVPVTLALNMVPKRPDATVTQVTELARDVHGQRRYAAIPQDDGLLRALNAGGLDVSELDQGTRVALKEMTVGLAQEWVR